MAAIDIYSAADTSTRATVLGDASTIAVGDEFARRALDGEGLALGDMDTGIILIESPYRVRCAIGKDESGIAQAVDARPVAIVVKVGDVYILQEARE